MDILSIQKELDEIAEDAAAKRARVAALNREIKTHEKNAASVADFLEEKVGEVVEKETFLKFFKNPYATIPFGKNKVLVAVPKFVKGFQVGWLWKETDTFYIYQFDQYSAWLGDAPVELLESINFKKGLDLTIEGNNIVFPSEFRNAVRDRLKHHLNEIGDNDAKIKRGQIFDVIAESIEQGCLPFKAKKVLASATFFMSFIYTCQPSDADPFDYLNALQVHANTVAADPDRWMPWNYKSAAV